MCHIITFNTPTMNAPREPCMHVNEFDEATSLLATVLFPLSKDCQKEKWKKDKWTSSAGLLNPDLQQ